jgi:gas vesicle protein
MRSGRYEEERMTDRYDRHESEGGAGFMTGLLTGVVLGVGFGMLLAPKAGSELRGQLGERARNLGTKAADRYRKAGSVASDWRARGRDMVDRVHEAATRGAEEARRYAADASGGTTGNDGPTGGSDPEQA